MESSRHSDAEQNNKKKIERKPSHIFFLVGHNRNRTGNQIIVEQKKIHIIEMNNTCDAMNTEKKNMGKRNQISFYCVMRNRLVIA